MESPRDKVVQGLIDGPLAWQTLDQLVCRLGLSIGEVIGARAELEFEGNIVTWEEWPQGTAVTFSPIGAERLGIEIFEVGPRETPRWFTKGTPAPRAPSAKRIFQDHETLGQVVDPSPGPAELAEIREEEAMRIHFPHGPGLMSWAWTQSRAADRRADKARDGRKAKRVRRNAQPATGANH
jgi:hypothetical protein